MSLKNRVETLSETKRLLERNWRKYWKRIFGLYTISFVHFIIEKKFDPQIGQLSRESYLLLRYIDDVLDGDLPIVGNPKQHIEDIKSQINGEKPSENRIAILAIDSIKKLEKRALENENPRELFIKIIDAMIFDFDRRQERGVLTNEDLIKYYYDTFAPILNLMFIGFGSSIRVTSENFADLAYCQGHIYSIRDLEDDWKVGIINIPKEILNSAGLTPDNNYQEVVNSNVIRNWIKKEVKSSRNRVNTLKTRIQESGETFTIFATNIALINHMIKALDKLENNYK
jgi:phytoene/squalene synthetase